jgi:acyl carrier protein
MKTEAQVLASLKQILADNFSIDGAKVTPEATFRGVLGLDSLDVVDLVFFIQEAFGLEDSLDDYRELHTVQKVCAYIASKAE